MEPGSPVLAGGVFTTEPLGGNPSSDDFNEKAGLTLTGLMLERLNDSYPTVWAMFFWGWWRRPVSTHIVAACHTWLLRTQYGYWHWGPELNFNLNWKSYVWPGALLLARAEDIWEPGIQVTGLKALWAVVSPTGEHHWAAETRPDSALTPQPHTFRTRRTISPTAMPRTAGTKHKSRCVSCGMVWSLCKTRRCVLSKDSWKGKTGKAHLRYVNQKSPFMNHGVSR